MRGRRIRNYEAMTEPKLCRVYTELVGGMNTPLPNEWEHEAYLRCVETGSGDPERDRREIERIADERMIDLDGVPA